MTDDGGGISNTGSLSINNCTINGNEANYRGSGIWNDGGAQLGIHNSTISGNLLSFVGSGGGVYNGGSLLISDSTISRNGAGNGGGLLNDGILTIDNSTLSSNRAIHGCHYYKICGGGFGGAFYDANPAEINTINNSTLGGNSASLAGGGIITCCGCTVLQNSIVANHSGGNCNGTITSSGYNLSSDNTCNFSGPGDQNSTDPLLGTFGNHGGPTQTIPLRIGSPAIDAGNPSGCRDGQGNLLTTDQRDMPRPDSEDKGGRCDMGAYERQSD